MLEAAMRGHPQRAAETGKEVDILLFAVIAFIALSIMAFFSLGIMAWRVRGERPEPTPSPVSRAPDGLDRLSDDLLPILTLCKVSAKAVGTRLGDLYDAVVQSLGAALRPFALFGPMLKHFLDAIDDAGHSVVPRSPDRGT
jgi:hypothetical protein